MKYDKIEVVTLSNEGFETDRRDFETVKEAKAWVRNCALSADYWEMASESKGYAARNVATVRLMADGECLDDWFPTFAEVTNA